jgi:hypothetical protein
MGTTIAILDDTPERIAEMLSCLAKIAPGIPVVAFDNSPDMIDWLAEHLDDARLICLDHDLGPNRIRDGEVFDPGTGRDVADYLATREPCCPIIIHTTNGFAAPGMELVLSDSGWQHRRVVPFDDLDWIGEDWLQEVQATLLT